jgi:hypothetical protein
VTVESLRGRREAAATIRAAAQLYRERIKDRDH